ncbi:kinase-like domain-containing protein [Mycena alexandri]|uniref:Kinase-like domain-containing protein n=1 Tax=Mycena alexandri TaxID=1745969 RepID=A0AAD6SLP9_9AGAR|nr:kinase-like domain-containing protein [Mycena alexandri]
MDPADMDFEDTEPLPETQEHQEPTPSPPDPERDALLWGYLQRYPGKERHDLRRDCPVVTIGRHIKNTICLPHIEISSAHATIRWSGVQNGVSVVTMEDHSSNGSYVEGTGFKRAFRTLRNKDEISFINSQPPPPGDTTMDDFRFIYYDLASPVRGVLERYQLGEVAGRGTFSTVYKAYDRKEGTLYAVKAIHADKSLKMKWSRDNDTVTQQQVLVQREIDVMTQLTHPNVSRLLDYFWNADGSIDLVLEYMLGGDLHDFIVQHDGLSERMTKHLMQQLCHALAFIHSKNIAHRDLKPENVLLTTDRPPILKIADFGLAKMIDYEARLYSICGTAEYLAPEVALHMIHGTGYGKELDAFAVGGIFYGCITLLRPLFSNMPEGPYLLKHVKLPDRKVDYRSIAQHVISVDEEGYPVYLSTQGRGFLRGLMEYDPVKRLTMVQALAHPWFAFNQADTYAPPPEPLEDWEDAASPPEDVVMYVAAADPATDDATTTTPNASQHNAGVTARTPRVSPSMPATSMEDDDEVAPGLTSLKNKGRMLERQCVALARARSQQQLFEPPPELLRSALKLLASASAPELGLGLEGEGTTAACVARENNNNANKRKYEPEEHDGDMSRTMSPEPETDPPMEPALKKGKSVHGHVVDPDAMDVSPRKRGGRGRGR